MQILKRRQAMSQGLMFYYTGKSCRHGHTGKRYTSNGQCVPCVARPRLLLTEQEKLLHKKAQDRAYYASNRGRVRAKVARYKRENPHTHRISKAKRRAAKLQRTPPWANLEAIKAFYEACPKGHHVDHHYPLQGEICSGLHVLENLRYLTASENCSKRNSMPQDFSRRAEEGDCFDGTGPHN